MAIVLFFIEKTPFWTGALLFVMFALLIHPIFHFAKPVMARAFLLIFALVLTGAFGRAIWPKTKIPALPEAQILQAAPMPVSQLTQAQRPIQTAPKPKSAPKTPKPRTTEPPMVNSMQFNAGNGGSDGSPGGSINLTAGNGGNASGDNAKGGDGGSINLNVNPDPKQPVITWFRDGTQRISKPGLITDAPGESAAYHQMLDLRDKKEWKSLFDLCKSETAKAPEWITPYYYMGMSYANTGQFDLSVEAFKYVEDHASGNADYQDLPERAKTMREQVQQHIENLSPHN
jgi:hypothetical protein